MKKHFTFTKNDPIKNPSVLDAREANSDYIIFYFSLEKRWILERVKDKVIVAAGTLESMLALTSLFPNSRRASWAEDMLRFKPLSWELEYDFKKTI